ncbi:LysR family transcriptional regulator [Rhizobium lusitanum]|uniref:LysR family transcriptional regulator n=1 Tax=Rhizobium lusitanum TaxID=293958 RepID=A0A6L9UCI7_9HYPH|nr:LysR substrate-binding domain-containing protein [Rhizobium lusitanum]NEI73665.1 LysR family transcriptional regulator [Rhizobium lusitanum]
MKFKIRQMEVFRAVMISGSITNAAKMLFVSQPAISRIVAHTESSLGLQLFKRSKGKLIPTPEALRLFEQVEVVYDSASRASQFAENLAGNLNGTIHLSISPCLSRMVIARAVAPFTKRYPDVSVHIHSRMLGELPFDLLSSKSHVAVSVQPLEHANLISETVTTTRMVCALPRGHRLCDGETVKLSDIAAEPMVMHAEKLTFGELVRDAFKAEKLSHKAVSLVHQTDNACSLVNAGVGLAIIDPYSAHWGGYPDVVTRPISRTIPLRPSIVRSNFENLGTETERFIKYVSKMNWESAP